MAIYPAQGIGAQPGGGGQYVADVVPVADETARKALVYPDDIQLLDFAQQGDDDSVWQLVQTDPSLDASWVERVPILVASTTDQGIVELATDDEVIAGSDSTRAIVPSSLRAKLLGGYELDPSPDTDLTANGIWITDDVDTNATGFGALLYLNPADGNYDEADADSAATMPCSGLALESGTGSKKILLKGFARKDAWNWTVGGLLFVDTTTGALTQTAPAGTGDQIQCVGYAKTADIIWFEPNYVQAEVA